MFKCQDLVQTLFPGRLGSPIPDPLSLRQLKRAFQDEAFATISLIDIILNDEFCNRHAVDISQDSSPEIQAQALNALGAALYTSGISSTTPLEAREQHCKEAEQALEKAVAFHPDFAAALFNLSKLQVSLSNFSTSYKLTPWTMKAHLYCLPEANR